MAVSLLNRRPRRGFKTEGSVRPFDKLRAALSYVERRL
jgi:hypothetical protein